MKTNKDITILIDIDDTSNDLCERWCKYLNNKYGTKVKYTDMIEWDVTKVFPTLTKKQVYGPLYLQSFWATVGPRPYARRYIKKLVDEGYNVYFCTATDYRNVKAKYETLIKKYFPFMSWDKVIVTSNKQMLKADFLVDDGVHNLENGDYYKILMSAPHNLSYNAKKNNMYRVDDWKETYELITSLAQKIKAS